MQNESDKELIGVDQTKNICQSLVQEVFPGPRHAFL